MGLCGYDSTLSLGGSLSRCIFVFEVVLCVVDFVVADVPDTTAAA